jgi:hypothetical protein
MQTVHQRKIMSTYQNGSPLGRIVTWVLVGVVAIVAIKVAFAIAGLVIGVGSIVLFTLGPILLAGWLIVMALRYFTRDRNDIAV